MRPVAPLMGRVMEVVTLICFKTSGASGNHQAPARRAPGHSETAASMSSQTPPRWPPSPAPPSGCCSVPGGYGPQPCTWHSSHAAAPDPGGRERHGPAAATVRGPAPSVRLAPRQAEPWGEVVASEPLRGSTTRQEGGRMRNSIDAGSRP